jgi:formate dehydrogenase major subunit
MSDALTPIHREPSEPSEPIATIDSIELTIDGTSVAVPAGTTVWDAARRIGAEIPVLCHDPRYRPVGVCRMCVVDVGGRVLAAACVRPCEPGMKVTTQSPAIEQHRAMLTALLLADQPLVPRQERPGGNALQVLAARYGLSGHVSGDSSVGPLGLPRGGGRPADDSSPVIGVDHQACILCDRCVRACDEVQSNEVITRSGKGYAAKIAFDLDLPMGSSSCVSCGECMDACPTDALVNKPLAAPLRPPAELKQVETLCPYCGVGCSITAHVDEDAEQGRVDRRPRQPGLGPPPVRQGPLRLRLREPRAAAHCPADPRRRELPEGAAVGRGAPAQGPAPGRPGRRPRGAAALS